MNICARAAAWTLLDHSQRRKIRSVPFHSSAQKSRFVHIVCLPLPLPTNKHPTPLRPHYLHILPSFLPASAPSLPHFFPSKSFLPPFPASDPKPPGDVRGVASIFPLLESGAPFIAALTRACDPRALSAHFLPRSPVSSLAAPSPDRCWNLPRVLQEQSCRASRGSCARAPRAAPPRSTAASRPRRRASTCSERSSS